MYQIDNSSAVAAIPASTAPGTAGFFTDGNPATGVPATIFPAEFANMLMMELIGVLNAAGIAPSKSKFTQLAAAISQIVQAGGPIYGVDVGSANTYAVKYATAVGSVVDGMVLKFKAANANTGASTFTPAPGVISPSPVVGPAHSALQGGEIVATGDVWLQWNSSIGSGSWVLIDSTGGAIQVANAAHSQQAVAMGQLYGELKGIACITTSGTFIVPAGVTQLWVSGVAGGGGGAAGCGGSSTTWGGGGSGGGAGQPINRTLVNVVPGATITITIGAAGLGGTGVSGTQGNKGTDGGVTIISGLASGSITLSGGPAGVPGSLVSTGYGGGGLASAGGYPSGGDGNDASQNQPNGIGGTGASSPFGGGGGNGRSAAGLVGAPGKAAGGYGAGGGGGGSAYNPTTGPATGGAGGSGSPGVVFLEW